MVVCQYPGCPEEAVYFSTQPRTWLERVADLGGPGYCKAHEFFKLIDQERYRNTNFMGRSVLEIMAVEDLAFLRELDQAARSFEPTWAGAWLPRF
jgi:hypothetical protein